MEMGVCDTTSGGGGELILHRWPAAWGLPSLFPECVAVALRDGREGARSLLKQ
jgi:hypothetical protein